MKSDREDALYVLLVEDDPVASSLLKRSLENSQLCSSFVDQAYSVEEALTKLQENTYDILLTEPEVKDDSAAVLIQRIQTIPRLSIPCMLLGDPFETANREEAMQAGAIDFVIKDRNNTKELMDKMLKVSKTFWEKRKINRQDRRRVTDRSGDFIPEDADFTHPVSIQDELTGLYTHSYLHDRLHLEFSRAKRYGAPLSCLVLDIDHFKAINQKYGFKSADFILKQCANLLFDKCRLSDIISRYGGEEFAILLPNTDYEGARELAERIKGLFKETSFDVNEKKIRVNVSVGISSFPDDPAEQCGEIVDFATQSLFKSKTSGRGSITLYRDVLQGLNEVLPEMKVSQGKISEFQRKMTEISNVARRAYLDASRTLITLLEAKDTHTAGHSANTAKYSMQTAQVMGLSPEEVEIVQHGALLHDIGKICIPDAILLKPGKLTFQEYETIKQHTYLGYKIIKPIQFLQQEALIVLHHHEWWNGEGYPSKLKGNEIPLGARIVGVVDAYDTIRLAGGRYKKTTTVASAAGELIAYAGTQFDPNVVAAFLEVLKIRKELTEDEIDRKKLDKAIKEAPTRI